MRISTCLALIAVPLVAHLAAAPLHAAPPDPMPKLRTGERKVENIAEPLVVTVDKRSLDASEEILSLSATWPQGDAGRIDQVSVRSAGGGAVFAIRTEDRIWIRRSARDATKALEGELYAPAGWRSPEAVKRYHFSVTPPARSGGDASAVRKEFGDACQTYFGQMRWSNAFHGFAAERLHARYAPPPFSKAGTGRTAPIRPGRGSEIERLMDTTTGMASIQEAIQADRPLWIQTAREKQTEPLSGIKGPTLTVHPFAEMLKKLGKPVPEEKLATATPADFYYLRLNDLAVFFRIVDQLDAWATPAVNVIEGRGEDHAISERNLTQLGLERTQLARALGTQVVADLALVGSDPYVREGSDQTVIFRVKQKALFDVALGNALTNHAKNHPLAVETKLDHQGTAIRVQRSTDGMVRQHRATAGDLEIVSNSAAAVRRVLDAIAGRTPRLSDEPDLKYMLARGAGVRTDAFAFLGDRFVAEVVGPRQKIMEARRQMALSDLLIPGHAALLYGWLEGRTPATTDELVASGLLGKGELRHVADDSPIAFAPGRGARSSWGSPSAMEPLLDMPMPKLVSKSEKEAYQRFADSYQRYWQQYLDPIAVRIGVEPDGKAGTRLVADVRVLPLIEGTHYREIFETVGRARLMTPTIGGGVRAVFGIGADARLRRELTRAAGSSPLGERIALDWLGDWLFFGVEDRVELARTMMALEPRGIPQAPSDEERSNRDEITAALKTPAYFALGIRNLLGATVFLTAIKKFASDAAPGIVQWVEGPPYKGSRTVHISVAPRSMGSSSPGADVWYALTDSAIIFTLQETVLHHVLDDQAGGKGTRAVDKQDGASQFVLDWASEKGQPLNTMLGWLLEAVALESANASRMHAEALLRGAPGASLREIGLAYEGAEPLPPDGGHYTLGPDGVRDPARGSALIEKWPALPVPGSPVERLVNAVARFRGEIGFDDEPRVDGQPPMRSLHAKVTLGLRP